MLRLEVRWTGNEAGFVTCGFFVYIWESLGTRLTALLVEVLISSKSCIYDCASCPNSIVLAGNPPWPVCGWYESSYSVLMFAAIR